MKFNFGVFVVITLVVGTEFLRAAAYRQTAEHSYSCLSRKRMGKHT